jgi:DNA-binding transcriptional regulator YdaS (Cro superfamily)
VLLSVALKIEQATEGAVKCSDMQPNEEYFKPPGGARKGRKAKDMSKPPEELSPPTPSQ